MNSSPETRPEYWAALRRHYSQPDLTEQILAALCRWGVEPDDLTRNDLTAVDEFHIGGRAATRQLAREANLTSGKRVLDLGCGIGGPARTLAAEFKCHVTGVDVIPEYVAAARELSRLLGLESSTSFLCADITAVGEDERLEASAGRFDVVWLQHVLPNVPDKPRLLAGTRRQLRPGGRLALYDICSGPGGDPYLPLPWAGDTDLSFTLTPDALQQQIAAAGFRIAVWTDSSDTALQWFREAVADRKAQPKGQPRPPSLRLLMGDTAADKSRNMVRNLEENRIAVVAAIAELSA